MKVLVIGSGGREHALTWKLASSPHVATLWCAPGNAGTATERTASGVPVTNVPIKADDVPALRDFALRERVDLTVVGPDNPLAAGVVDVFQAAGLRIWGPNRRAAQFESSKAFSQEFMRRHGIPTARAGVFDDPAAAERFAAELGGRCAVKADGLALGKGVLLTNSHAEAREAIRHIMLGNAFGGAGSRIVIQELLEGMEISLHALCDGRCARLFPTAQDHKRIHDGDHGQNTGGMGAYSPAPFLAPAQLEEVGRAVLDPWLAGCAADGIDFRGLLYPGVMLTRQGPKVLEFNARFGDPEAQCHLPRLENDLVELLSACVDGQLADVELCWSSDACVCVVLAASGYPGEPQRGQAIGGLEEAAAMTATKVFHAGTMSSAGRVVTSGGRVLGVTAWGADLRVARDRAYAACEHIRFDGMQYRRDIGAKGLAVAG